jgi:hypothetical protein
MSQSAVDATIVLSQSLQYPKTEEQMLDALTENTQFRGSSPTLDMCLGARVHFTVNKSVIACLVNGIIGLVRGYILPAVVGTNAVDPRSQAPFCVIVEFDDVNLVKNFDARLRTFFPNKCSGGLDLVAWDDIKWTKQCMTLNKVGVQLGKPTAAAPAITFVSCTRIKNVSALLFK